MSGINYDLQLKEWSNEKFYMARLFEKNDFSLNVGLNEELLAATVAYKTKFPLSIHSGITKPIDHLLDLKYKPGIFFGVEFRF